MSSATRSAVGARPRAVALELVFPPTPVHGASRRSLVLHGVALAGTVRGGGGGEDAAVTVESLDGAGAADAGATTTVLSAAFRPSEARAYAGELWLSPGAGARAGAATLVRWRGVGVDVGGAASPTGVFMSAAELRFGAIAPGCSAHDAVTLVNRGETAAAWRWCSGGGGGGGGSGGDTFASPAYSMTPAAGILCARSSVSLTASFSPPASAPAGECAATAHLAVTGRAARLALRLVGAAAPPALAFAYDVVDFGAVWASSLHRYEVPLVNRGAAAVRWRAAPPTSARAALCLALEPRAAACGGALPPGGRDTLVVFFAPGEPCAAFREGIALDVCHAAGAAGGGGEESTPAAAPPLRIALTLCGAGLAPTFSLLPAAGAGAVDWGVVGCGSTQWRDVELRNTCGVTCAYTARVDCAAPGAAAAAAVEGSEDGGGDASGSDSDGEGGGGGARRPRRPRPFRVAPRRVSLASGAAATLRVSLSPLSADAGRDYAGHVLRVAVAGVAAQPLGLPLLGRCAEPALLLAPPRGGGGGGGGGRKGT